MFHLNAYFQIDLKVLDTVHREGRNSLPLHFMLLFITLLDVKYCL